MSLAAKLVLALALLVAGFAAGIKWHVGIVAERELAAQRARETDARQQRQFNDRQAGTHAEAVQTLNDQLGTAYAKLAKLTGRTCLSPDAVGVLNATGVLERGAAPGQPASAPRTAEAAGGLRWATDIDLANYIAYCRTRYGAVADQLNKILDIEERRHPPAKP